jgi:hypothetical protein
MDAGAVPGKLAAAILVPDGLVLGLAVLLNVELVLLGVAVMELSGLALHCICSAQLTSRTESRCWVDRM